MVSNIYYASLRFCAFPHVEEPQQKGIFFNAATASQSLFPENALHKRRREHQNVLPVSMTTVKVTGFLRYR